jgi:hypothetical protein
MPSDYPGTQLATWPLSAFASSWNAITRALSSTACLFPMIGPPAEVDLRLVDLAQELAEDRRILDRPDPGNGRAKPGEVALGEQANRYDAIIGQAALRRLSAV